MVSAAASRYQTSVAWLHERIPEGERRHVRLSNDSRQIRKGDVFLAYPGARSDGRSYIPAVIAAGAAGVLWDDALPFRWNPTWQVANRPESGLKAAAGEIAAVWYGHPAERMRVVGITGTSGKSSCALWVAQALTLLGERCAVAGTLGMGFVPDGSTQALRDTGKTTPDAIELQADMHRLADEGAAALAIEVSSIGLAEGRINGMHFDVGVFTNLSRDHLDYHGSMANYAAAKAQLFAWPGLRAAVVNIDDAAGADLARTTAAGVHLLRYSASGDSAADLRAIDVEFGADGMRFTVVGKFGRRGVQTHLIGGYNVANFLALLGVLLVAGHSIDAALAALSRLVAVPGRLERVDAGSHTGPLVLVDYAHKPDALEKVLLTCRPLATGRLVVVFGCGGARDAGKRPIMAHIAQSLADRVVVTSDNPRSEDPDTIIAGIVAGFEKSAASNWLVEPDRARAIAQAIAKADVGDVVLIAGKGHETYQELAQGKVHFSDVEQAGVALRNWVAPPASTSNLEAPGC